MDSSGNVSAMSTPPTPGITVHRISISATSRGAFPDGEREVGTIEHLYPATRVSIGRRESVVSITHDSVSSVLVPSGDL